MSIGNFIQGNKSNNIYKNVNVYLMRVGTFVSHVYTIVSECLCKRYIDYVDRDIKLLYFQGSILVQVKMVELICGLFSKHFYLLIKVLCQYMLPLYIRIKQVQCWQFDPNVVLHIYFIQQYIFFQ